MDKLFTLDEAHTLLPVLESLLHKAMDAKGRLRQLQQQMQDIVHSVFLSGGKLLRMSEMADRKAERDACEQTLRDAVEEIQSMGVQVKDLDIGLLDFPCEVDGEIILLCWKLGEPRIAHWHSQEDGFKGRKPIDERIANARRPRPN